MRNRKELTQDFEFMTILKALALAYQDISIMKMQQTRAVILHARDYVTKLKDVVEAIQRAEVFSNVNSKHSDSKKKPYATVIITANAKFHGEIMRRIFDAYIKEHREEADGDIFIIGKIGKEYMHEYNNNKLYTELEVSDIDISMQDLRPFLQKLLEYKHINVYYAIFRNLVVQEATHTDIANVELLTPDEIDRIRNEPNKPMYLFEPTFEEIFSFVKNNALALLLLQTVYETQLARFASRMKAMDTLIQNIDANVDKLKVSQRKLNRLIENNKQLDRISGVALW